ncbi:MAG: hypothetical protein WBA97_34410 [Actinophytocola sp.]|uniref:hypothetical protein n=1 Tax=Actinophytocola sp. TaxID=1872138 RepID=UPI003C71E0F7
MPLSQDEVRALLAIAVAYDNRKPGEVTIAAWMEAADRGRWTFPAAVEAIHDHYAKSTDFLMPGHITAAVRARMQLPAPASEVAQLEAARPAEEAIRKRWSAVIREKFAMPSRLRDEPGRARERRPQRRSADDAAARERARRELDAIRDREREEPPDDLVG